MKKGFQHFATTMMLIAIAFTACKKTTIDDIKSNDKVFSPSLFKQNIVTALGNRSIGYTFIINHNGKWADSAQRGFARMSQDGAIAHSVYKEMNIASVSKWLTAVGAMKLLSFKKIKLEDSIYKWLPQSWTLGKNVKTVTFSQLLTHKGGLTTNDIRYATDYNSLKTCIAKGVVNDAKGYNYSNVNFALFRIMFAHIWNKPNTNTAENVNLILKDTATFADFLATSYLDLMQQFVFTPAGVSEASCTAENRATMTLMYNETTPTTGGIVLGDWKPVCGGGGYFLSVYEIAKVMAYVYHTEDILTKAQQQELLENRYGLDNGLSPNTNKGQSYGKDGVLFNDVNGSKNDDNPDPGLQTLVMKFPAEVEVVFFINALNGGFVNYATLMKNAYEDAWVKP